MFCIPVQVTEEFSTIGETSMARRDLRPGQQTARAAYTPEGLRINIVWGAPYACATNLSFCATNHNDHRQTFNKDLLLCSCHSAQMTSLAEWPLKSLFSGRGYYCAGMVDDLYQLQSPNTLLVTSKITVGGRTESTLQACPEYYWASRAIHVI